MEPKISRNITQDSKNIGIIGTGYDNGSLGFEVISRFLERDKAIVNQIYIQNTNFELTKEIISSLGTIKNEERKINGTKVRQANSYQELMENSDLIILTLDKSKYRQNLHIYKELLKDKNFILRDAFLAYNFEEVKTVANEIKKTGIEKEILVVTSTIDYLCPLVSHYSGIDPHKIYGFGGAIDTERFVSRLEQKLNRYDEQIVLENVYSLLEHGPKNFYHYKNGFYFNHGTINRLIEKLNQNTINKIIKDVNLEVKHLLENGSGTNHQVSPTLRRQIEKILYDGNQGSLSTYVSIPELDFTGYLGFPTVRKGDILVPDINFLRSIDEEDKELLFDRIKEYKLRIEEIFRTGIKKTDGEIVKIDNIFKYDFLKNEPPNTTITSKKIEQKTIEYSTSAKFAKIEKQRPIEIRSDRNLEDRLREELVKDLDVKIVVPSDNPDRIILKTYSLKEGLTANLENDICLNFKDESDNKKTRLLKIYKTEDNINILSVKRHKSRPSEYRINTFNEGHNYQISDVLDLDSDLVDLVFKDGNHYLLTEKDLVRYDPSKNSLENLCKLPENCNSLVPSDKGLFLIGKNEIYSFENEKLNKTPIYESEIDIGSKAIYDPDSRLIVFNNKNKDITIIDIDSGDKKIMQSRSPRFDFYSGEEISMLKQNGILTFENYADKTELLKGNGLKIPLDKADLNPQFFKFIDNHRFIISHQNNLYLGIAKNGNHEIEKINNLSHYKMNNGLILK
ncbi:hypothetical protein C0585_04065 [Candidatus Woesearchaeota archaeon]|nr:MAG: hypothetical protein C0585_04065 [Candidatus Woesearchaeota archaeon]